MTDDTKAVRTGEMWPDHDRRNHSLLDRRNKLAISAHLELLSEMSSHLAGSLDTGETIQKALGLIVRFVMAEGGALFLLDNNHIITCEASVGPVDIKGITLREGEGIVGQCVSNGSSRIVRDAQHDPNFDKSVDAATGFKTLSILCAPLIIHSKSIGAIELVNKSNTSELFSETDLMMLQTLASAAALAIHNARIAGKLVKQERVNRELELASEMQRSLLPDPRDSSFPVCGINLPAYEMSGDFYDFFELDDGRIYFALGDVSGKGINAALLMSKTASLFRALGKTIHQPGELLATINRELCETAINGMFVTMVSGLLDPVSSEVRLANAGHEPPLIHARDGSFSELPASSPPLGILPLEAGEAGIRNEIFNLNGGALYVFTDGVTEGKLASGGRLELEGFKNIIRKRQQFHADERIGAVVTTLRDTGSTRHDDITLLAVEIPAACHIDTNRDNPKDMIRRHTFQASADALPGVREITREACEACGCTAELTQDMVIAISEASQNIVRHAYRDDPDGTATLEIRCKDGILEFLLEDSAPAVDSEKLKPNWPKKLKPGGLGICLIHDVMDEVEYLPVPSGKGNLLRMAKFIERDETNGT
ncbi:MAG: SpoIIE family protein phosphatase [Gammaproteobacteria bacterium]